jgi:hypothetical protein
MLHVQVFLKSDLKSEFRKFNGGYHNLVRQYKIRITFSVVWRASYHMPFLTRWFVYRLHRIPDLVDMGFFNS